MILIAASLIALATAPETTPSGTPVDEGIAQPVIDEAVKVGELSGVAQACGLDWQPHYDAYLAAKRKQKTTELDMIFLAGYHGGAQVEAYNMVSKDCTQKQRDDIQNALNENIAKYTK
ncbi:MAG: hypothetical protein MK052_04055 [Alphaproteobacteria bacterium]|nr:hypothetical protein [Alphaproteobacteria bacterium]